MLRAGPKSVFTLIIIFTFYTCIEPYNPNLSGYGPLLVVDGMITDENASNTVRLSHTLQDQKGIISMVSGATVYFTDDEGHVSYLKSTGNGIYKTDSTIFRGVVGRQYVLNIETGDGKKYESNKCLMTDVPDIDSIYFEKDEEIVNNGTEFNEGIMIYLDTKRGDINKCYRWEFIETWKFKVPTPTKSTYFDEKTIIMNHDIKDYCWKVRKSNEILIHSVQSGGSGSIKKKPVCFIASDKSDRLRLEYSILVKQYSVSKSEFDFWDNLNKINDKSGDIFEYQPYPVSSNIHNINDPEEQILGYFQVSAVKEKRMFLSFSDIAKLNLPYYMYKCERIEASPKDPPWNKFIPPLTFDEIYNMFVTSGYNFVEPKYYDGTMLLDELVFAKPECSNCELSGTSIKPDYWKDFKLK